MSDYNVKAIIDEALDSKKDPNFPRSRVLGYIQRTQDAVLGHHRFKFSEDTTSSTLGANSTTYEFDCDHQEIITLVLTHASLSGVIQPTYMPNTTFFEEFPNPDASTAAAPRYYTDFGGDLYWNAPLDKGYNLKLRYVATPSRLEDDDNCQPDIPQEFDEILLLGAKAGIENYRGNLAVAAVHRREIEDLEEDLLGRYGLRKRQPGKARAIRRQGER